MTELLCQSGTRPVLNREYPCTNKAAVVLFGVHLCRAHDHIWRERLQAGQKIRIHPDRPLPLDHHCTAPSATEAEHSGSTTRLCSHCRVEKPLSEFYRQSRNRSGVMAECRACFNARPKGGYGPRKAESAPSVIRAPEPPEAEPEPPPSAAPRIDEPSRTPVQMRSGGYVWIAQLDCLQCGDQVAQVVVAAPNVPARAPSGLRCKRCGGQPVQTGDVERRWVGPEPRFTPDELPRRGRPLARIAS